MRDEGAPARRPGSMSRLSYTPVHRGRHPPARAWCQPRALLRHALPISNAVVSGWRLAGRLTGAARWATRIISHRAGLRDRGSLIICRTQERLPPNCRPGRVRPARSDGFRTRRRFTVSLHRGHFTESIDRLFGAGSPIARAFAHSGRAGHCLAAGAERHRLR